MSYLDILNSIRLAAVQQTALLMLSSHLLLLEIFFVCPIKCVNGDSLSPEKNKEYCRDCERSVQSFIDQHKAELRIAEWLERLGIKRCPVIYLDIIFKILLIYRETGITLIGFCSQH